MTNEYKDKLRQHISDSDLLPMQKELWEIFLMVSNEEEDEAVLEAVSEGKETLYLLTKHLRDKIWNMKEMNKKSWKKLIGDESQYAHLLS